MGEDHRGVEKGKTVGVKGRTVGGDRGGRGRRERRLGDEGRTAGARRGPPRVRRRIPSACGGSSSSREDTGEDTTSQQTAMHFKN